MNTIPCLSNLPPCEVKNVLDEIDSTYYLVLNENYLPVRDCLYSEDEIVDLLLSYPVGYSIVTLSSYKLLHPDFKF